MHSLYASEVDFLTIYIKEAHPEDGWPLGVNDDDGVCYADPTTLDERLAIARDFVDRFQYDLPLAVDGMENAAMDIFAGWPERLFIIDADGTLAYEGGIGPMDFEPDEVEDWLAERFPRGASPPWDSNL